MIEFVRDNAHYITLVFIIAGCIVGWYFFDPGDWGRRK